MCSNLGITVNELKAYCEDQIKAGNGDKHIIISDDDEGNGFHTLFCEFQSDPIEVEMLLQYEQNGTHTVDNCVVLG